MRYGISAVVVGALVSALLAYSIVVAADAELAGPEAAPSDELTFIGPEGGLWLTQIGRGPMRLLLAQGEFSDYSWSPDGRRVAYIAADGGLALLDVVSGRRARLSDGLVQEIAWAPDSDAVAFTRDHHLWLVATRGGSPTRLTEWAPSTDDRLGRLLWTGDGRYLMFQTSRARGGRELGVVEVKPRRVRTFPLAGGTGSLEAAATSPDSRTVLVPYWQDDEPNDGVCRRLGLPRLGAMVSADDSGSLMQVLEQVALPSMERRAIACWGLSEDAAASTGWTAPMFLRDGLLALVPTVDAPSGLVVLDRAGTSLDPRVIGLMSTVEEGGRILRRYPTEVVSNGRTAALVYRQDEQHAQGLWFSFELHIVDSPGQGDLTRDVVLRDGCLCPDDRSDMNVADVQLSPDGTRIAFTYFHNGVNRIAIAARGGQLAFLADGERPMWRPAN